MERRIGRKPRPGRFHILAKRECSFVRGFRWGFLLVFFSPLPGEYNHFLIVLFLFRLIGLVSYSVLFSHNHIFSSLQLRFAVLLIKLGPLVFISFHIIIDIFTSIVSIIVIKNVAIIAIIIPSITDLHYRDPNSNTPHLTH